LASFFKSSAVWAKAATGKATPISAAKRLARNISSSLCSSTRVVDLFFGGSLLLVDCNHPTHFMVLLFGAADKLLLLKACYVRTVW
jgi:hypothetical protein